MPGSTIVVVVAHGSRLSAATEAHHAVCAAVRADVDSDTAVVPAFLEIDRPDIATAVDDAVTAGASRVVVLPYFLHPGNHTGRDIPAAVAASRQRHPGVAIELAESFGADPRLVDTLAAQIRGLVER